MVVKLGNKNIDDITYNDNDIKISLLIFTLASGFASNSGSNTELFGSSDSNQGSENTAFSFFSNL